MSSSEHGSLRPWVMAAFAFGALLGPMTAGAQAGTYVIDNCPSAPTANTNPGPWVIFGSPQLSKGTCSGGAGDWIGPLGERMNAAGSDGVQVTVPSASGITIQEAKVWWSVPQEISGANNFAVAYADGAGVGEAGTPAVWQRSPDVFVLPSETTTFQLTDYCSNDDASQPCVFGSAGSPNLQLYGAQLTLADSVLPSGTVTGGGLAGSGALSGTESISYDARDSDSGVRRVELLVDGKSVAEHDYIADCPYESFAACPTSLSDELQWNTTGATNGTHEVALRVVNAAGDSSILDGHSVSIANQPVHVNGSSVTGALAPVANGDPCAGEELEPRGQRPARQSRDPVRQGSHSQGRAALRHRGDPRRSDRRSHRGWLAERGDRQLRSERLGRLLLIRRAGGSESFAALQLHRLRR